MNNNIKISTVLMIAFGILIIAFYTCLFIFFCCNIYQWEILNASEVYIGDQIDSSYNNRYVLLNKKITFDEVNDNVFNVTLKDFNSFGLIRIVEKRINNQWIVINEGQELSPFYTKLFFSNNAKLGAYNIDKQSTNIILNKFDNSILFDLNDIELSNAHIPNGYKLTKQIDYSHKYFSINSKNNSYELYNVGYEINYITNSIDINNPIDGDIRIYYGKLNALTPYYRGYGKINGDNVLLNDFIDRVDYVNYDILVFANFGFKILFAFFSIILLIGFVLLLFGISRLNIIEKRFGKIKKYKILLISFILGIIMPLILVLLK